MPPLATAFSLIQTHPNSDTPNSDNLSPKSIPTMSVPLGFPDPESLWPLDGSAWWSGEHYKLDSGYASDDEAKVTPDFYAVSMREREDVRPEQVPDHLQYRAPELPMPSPQGHQAMQTEHTECGDRSDPELHPDDGLYNAFCYSQADGDVVLSLSASSQDSLLVRSQVLAHNSEWFRRSLGPNWQQSKTTGARQLDNGDVVHMNRYELTYSGMGQGITAILEGRTGETPWKERREATNETFAMPWTESIENANTIDRDLGNNNQRLWRALIFAPLYYPLGVHDSLIEEASFVVAYKLGLSLILGLPLVLRRNYKLLRLQHSFPTAVLLKLIEFIQIYSSWSAAAGPISALLTSSSYRVDVKRYPCLYLRMACLIHSRELFRLGLQAVHTRCNKNSASGTMRRVPVFPVPRLLGQDSDLIHRVVVYQMWHDRKNGDLMHRIRGLCLVYGNPSTSDIATMVFRDWIVRWYFKDPPESVVQLFTELAGYSRRFSRPDPEGISRSWRHDNYRNMTLPPLPEQDQLVRDVKTIFEHAKDIINGAYVQQDKQAFGGFDLDPEEFFQDYEYPWEEKSAPRRQHCNELMESALTFARIEAEKRATMAQESELGDEDSLYA